jgi:hypothetical protein
LGCNTDKQNDSKLKTNRINEANSASDLHYFEIYDNGEEYHLYSHYAPSISASEGEKVYWGNFISSHDVVPAKELINLQDMIKVVIRGDIVDLSFLENIQQIKSLEITFSNKAVNLVPLKYLTELEELQLFYLLGYDISPIGNLSSLKHLTLICQNRSRVLNIDPIGKLTHLESLFLRTTYKDLIFISDSDIFANLSKLEHLTLMTDGEIDLTYIGILPKLKSLHIELNNATDSILLLKNPELTNLRLYGGFYAEEELDKNHKLNFDWLLNLNSLNVLVVAGFYIDDVRPLLKLSNLKGIEISGFTNTDIFLPLIDSDSIKSIFLEEEYYMNFPVKLFKERGITVWTDGK